MKQLIKIILMIALSNGLLHSQVEPIDTDGDGYRNISTLEHLLWVSENFESWSDSFELDNDIDASDTENWNEGEGFWQIGTNKDYGFKGVFDGNGYNINSLNISPQLPTPYPLGLFGHIDKEAIIRNLKLINSYIAHFYPTLYDGVGIGFIAGYNEGTIENCKANGYIEGTYIGGIVGQNHGIIKNCSSSGKLISPNAGGIAFLNQNKITECFSKVEIVTYDVSGGIAAYNHGEISICYFDGKFEDQGTTGGIAGTNTGEISNCYNRSDVNTTTKDVLAAGLVGNSEGKIINSYSAGMVGGEGTINAFVGRIDNDISNYENNFFNTDLSEQSTANGATGITSAEMRDINTFLDVDWDFETIWTIDGVTNDGYPFFKDVPTSIKKEEINESGNVFIYPNPATSVITISNLEPGTEYKIYNTLGIEVQSGIYNENINVSNLLSGIYFIQLPSTGETLKFVRA